MLDELKRALARVQSDYGFYVDLQANPAAALAGYDLSPEERAVLTDPQKLTDVLDGRRIGFEQLRPSITITISGKHDWVNRTRPRRASLEDVDPELIGTEVTAIRNARTDEERSAATLRLMEALG